MKTKALISLEVTAKLTCVFVLAYAKSRFSHDMAHIVKTPSGREDPVQTSLAFLAHLSRRLTGELIGYPWVRRRRPSVVRPSTFSNIFSSETAWPIKAKFYVEPPWEGGTKVCINGPGHMTKMAAMPIYGKNFKNLLLQNRKSYYLETLYAALGTQALQSLYKW